MERIQTTKIQSKAYQNNEATTYHSNTYETGRAKFEKDLMHTQGYTTNDIQKPNVTKEPLLRSWIGIKAVFYNLPDNNSVKLEQNIDDNSNNNWHKVLSYTEDGQWGGGTPNCEGVDTSDYMGRPNSFI